VVGLIYGGAVCVWDDVKAFRKLYSGPVVTIAINKVGWMVPGRLDHWISLHPENFIRKKWLEKRPPDSEKNGERLGLAFLAFGQEAVRSGRLSAGLGSVLSPHQKEWFRIQLADVIEREGYQ